MTWNFGLVAAVGEFISLGLVQEQYSSLCLVVIEVSVDKLLTVLNLRG